jgi:hypothetical protein
MRKLLVMSFVVLGLALGAAPAFAVDFCVAPNTTCGGTNVGDLQTALDWAAVSNNADRVFLGAATYSAPATGFTYDQTSGPVEIVGAGQGSTTLTGPNSGNERVLQLIGAPGTTIHHLRVEMPFNVATNAQGLQTNGLVHDVTVVDQGGEPNPHTGVVLEGGATLDHTVVGLDPNGDNTAVFLEGGANAVRDSVVNGHYAVVSNQDATLERSFFHGAAGTIIAYYGALRIASSEIFVDNAGARAIFAGAGGSQGGTLTIDGVVVAGLGAAGTVGIEANNTGAIAANISVSVDNAIIRGVDHSLRSYSGAGTGTVDVAAKYSDYDAAGNAQQGPKATLTEDHISHVDDAIAFGPDGWDDLLPNSPLIDAGDPSTPQGLDFASKPLLTDGDGDGTTRRDIGAIETFAVTPPSSDAGGQSPATDAGTTPDTPATETVAATPDKQGPVLTGVILSRKTFAIGRATTAIAARSRGTRLRYRLSEAATVVVRIVHGKRTIGKLTRHAAAGANLLRFSGRLGRRALRPGRYSAVVTATDAAGNKSRPQRVRFRVIP